MMVGKRFYSEADMMRMQRSAEERVLEMQQRAKRAAQHAGGSNSFMPSFVNPNRNWDSGPNNRRERTIENMNTQEQMPAPPLISEPEPAYEAPSAENQYPEPPPAREKSGTTVIDDIVGSLGIESDTLLIIGLILILINQKADTTLILALVYLLF